MMDMTQESLLDRMERTGEELRRNESTGEFHIGFPHEPVPTDIAMPILRGNLVRWYGTVAGTSTFRHPKRSTIGPNID